MDNNVATVTDGLDFRKTFTGYPYQPTYYQYDRNGNLTWDPNKGFQIYYTFHNLPSKAERINDTGKRIEWVWSATGARLKKQVYSGGMLTEETVYAGPAVYQRTCSSCSLAIDYLPSSEGRILFHHRFPHLPITPLRRLCSLLLVALLLAGCASLNPFPAPKPYVEFRKGQRARLPVTETKTYMPGEEAPVGYVVIADARLNVPPSDSASVMSLRLMRTRAMAVGAGALIVTAQGEENVDLTNEYGRRIAQTKMFVMRAQFAVYE